MTLYKCWNCGAVMEREEVVWKFQKFDQPAYDMYPFCCRCGSDDVSAEHACDICEAQPADDFLGVLHVCAGCARHIREAVERQRKRPWTTGAPRNGSSPGQTHNHRRKQWTKRTRRSSSRSPI